MVAYADVSKRELLAVSTSTLTAHGAVSEETARAMAVGARSLPGADVGVAITGVAGPDGGSDAKPLGTVHLAVAGPGAVLHRQVRIPGDRATVRRRAVVMALHLVRQQLES